jgi:23S rRNA (guanosine2251-2'-O)-methyltransferase
VRQAGGDPQSIEGGRPVLEALRAGRRKVLEIWLPADARSAVQREIDERARALGIPVHSVERSAETRARVEPYPEESFEALLASLASPRVLVALDGVTDVGNLGSIARSAETAGVAALVLELRHSPSIGPGALRASSGALEHLRLARTPSLPRALDLAHQEGLRILAADSAGEPLEALPPAELERDLVWIFGSEERGLRPSILARVDVRVGIPLHGRIESLGVAAAAAFLLHGTAARRAESARRASGAISTS